MDAAGPIVRKTSQKEALDILTIGVPTMSVSFDDRRQVFVESRTDAEIYSALYQATKSIPKMLPSDRSLTFIPIGKNKCIKDSSNNVVNNEVGGGCAAVIDFVDKLRSNGVDSIYGLIDWDNRNKDKNGIHVLASSKRYAIENLILDPVCLILALSQFCFTDAVTLEFIDQKHNIQFLGLCKDTKEWQGLVDRLFDVLGMDVTGKSQYVKYSSGLKLRILEEFLHKKGHDLEKQIREKIQILNKQIYGNVGLPKKFPRKFFQYILALYQAN